MAKASKHGAAAPQILTQKDAIDQIVETVKHAKPGTAPFVFVLGSGFSHGLVPTAKELVNVELPLWMKSLNDGSVFADLKKQHSADECATIARAYWKQFVAANSGRELSLALDPTGLPQSYSAAYQACFDSHFRGAVGEPAQAREFQRALMRLDQPRLNAAHFLLASLLGVQPGKVRPGPLFKAKAAFSRLILTTNFDPFLQIALQMVNRLYVMSDTPELGVDDDILDDEIDAIHLVYLHGSIHRRSQAAMEEDIHKLKAKNARTLKPVLKRRGVIVLGYSGWDDVIVHALAACADFNHRLYWCGRESDPLTPGAFGKRVPAILSKSSASYVKIDTAGHFMAQLCRHLVDGLPRLLADPIGQMHELLETINLKELANNAPPAAAEDAPLLALDGHDIGREFVQARDAALEGLEAATPCFHKAIGKTQLLLASARYAATLGNFQEAHKLCTAALASDGMEYEKAEAYLIRGRASYFLKNKADAVADWTSAIAMPRAPVEVVARALNYRGVVHYQQKPASAVDDYTQVIDKLSDAPVLQVAQALGNRGAVYAETKQPDKAMADYTHMIENLPGVPVEELAKGLYNRGLLLRGQGKSDDALADFTRIIEKLPGAPLGKVAQALADRGWTHYERQEYDGFRADTEAALRLQPTLDYAAFNIGLALLACGRDKDALTAYRRAAEQYPTQLQDLGLNDLKDAQAKGWLTAKRAAPVLELLQAPKK